MDKKEQLKNEEKDKREYQRLPSCFDVDFTIVRLQGDLPGISWEKGCTRDVSQKGMCLETRTLDESTLSFLSNQGIFLDLRIKVPLGLSSVKAVAEVVWFRKKEEDQKDKHCIGLHFRSIAEHDLKTILKHAKVKSFFNFFRSS